MAEVMDLICYPVKGCAGRSLSEGPLTAAGLAHDRTFMVTSEDGVYRTQRRHPRLALIRPTVSPDGTELLLDADGTEVRVAVTTSAPRRSVDLFGETFGGIDQGDEVADWLTAVLGTPSRLVRVPPEHDRIAAGRTPGPSGYADSSAVHLLSRASLALLDRRMAELGAPPLPLNRFRPNIVVDGSDWAAEPHAEDLVRRVRIGGTELGYAKLAVRCAVTLVDQETGARGGKEPLRTLARYRRAAGGGVVFGTKLSVLRPGKLSLGDEVAVDEWGAAER
ncbi:MOSC N-terminal beta barrel domain-containing protein [Streptomyces sp. NPDC048002]|uniref:MOSC domain-containing protein n=1 Tax=Streptomyces sp. NPDC048002 TaxID=3154344 RepID=UPI0033DF9D0B